MTIDTARLIRDDARALGLTDEEGFTVFCGRECHKEACGEGCKPEMHPFDPACICSSCERVYDEAMEARLEVYG